MGNTVDGALETSGSARGKALVASTNQPNGEEELDSSKLQSRYPHKQFKRTEGRAGLDMNGKPIIDVPDVQAKIKAYGDKVKALKAEKKPKDDPELVAVMNALSKYLREFHDYTSKTLADIGTLHMREWWLHRKARMREWWLHRKARLIL